MLFYQVNLTSYKYCNHKTPNKSCCECPITMSKPFIFILKSFQTFILYYGKGCINFTNYFLYEGHFIECDQMGFRLKPNLNTLSCHGNISLVVLKLYKRFTQQNTYIYLFYQHNKCYLCIEMLQPFKVVHCCFIRPINMLYS